MRVQACVNGARPPAEHPALPVTPAALASDAAAVAAAGADAVHLHVKDDVGHDTLDAGRLSEVLAAVRDAAPGLAVGVTTGAWAAPDAAARWAAVDRWTALPEFASVNWHEDGAEGVAALLIARGVDVEAGLWHEDAVAQWTRSPLRDQCRRVLLELPDGLDEQATRRLAARLLDAVGSASAVPVLLHGEGTSCWPALRHAAAAGLALRIGLEDTLELPDRTPAPGNEALVRAACQLLAKEGPTADPRGCRGRAEAPG